MNLDETDKFFRRQNIFYRPDYEDHKNYVNYD